MLNDFIYSIHAILANFLTNDLWLKWLRPFKDH